MPFILPVPVTSSSLFFTKLSDDGTFRVEQPTTFLIQRFSAQNVPRIIRRVSADNDDGATDLIIALSSTAPVIQEDYKRLTHAIESCPDLGPPPTDLDALGDWLANLGVLTESDLIAASAIEAPSANDQGVLMSKKTSQRKCGYCPAICPGFLKGMRWQSCAACGLLCCPHHIAGTHLVYVVDADPKETKKARIEQRSSSKERKQNSVLDSARSHGSDTAPSAGPARGEGGPAGGAVVGDDEDFWPSDAVVVEGPSSAVGLKGGPQDGCNISLTPVATRNLQILKGWGPGANGARGSDAGSGAPPSPLGSSHSIVPVSLFERATLCYSCVRVLLGARVTAVLTSTLTPYSIVEVDTANAKILRVARGLYKASTTVPIPYAREVRGALRAIDLVSRYGVHALTGLVMHEEVAAVVQLLVRLASESVGKVAIKASAVDVADLCGSMFYLSSFARGERGQCPLLEHYEHIAAGGANVRRLKGAKKGSVTPRSAAGTSAGAEAGRTPPTTPPLHRVEGTPRLPGVSSLSPPSSPAASSVPTVPAGVSLLELEEALFLLPPTVWVYDHGGELESQRFAWQQRMQTVFVSTSSKHGRPAFAIFTTTFPAGAPREASAPVNPREPTASNIGEALRTEGAADGAATLGPSPTPAPTRPLCVVSIRGTKAADDVMTDIDAGVFAIDINGTREHVHHGVYESALWLAQLLAAPLQEMARGGYKVILVGHSMGGAVAAMVVWLLRNAADALEGVGSGGLAHAGGLAGLYAAAGGGGKDNATAPSSSAAAAAVDPAALCEASRGKHGHLTAGSAAAAGVDVGSKGGSGVSVGGATPPTVSASGTAGSTTAAAEGPHALLRCSPRPVAHLEDIRAFTFGAPPCATSGIANTLSSCVTAYVNHDDAVARSSVAAGRRLMAVAAAVSGWGHHFRADAAALRSRVAQLWPPATRSAAAALRQSHRRGGAVRGGAAVDEWDPNARGVEGFAAVAGWGDGHRGGRAGNGKSVGDTNLDPSVDGAMDLSGDAGAMEGAAGAPAFQWSTAAAEVMRKEAKAAAAAAGEEVSDSEDEDGDDAGAEGGDVSTRRAGSLPFDLDAAAGIETREKSPVVQAEVPVLAVGGESTDAQRGRGVGDAPPRGSGYGFGADVSAQPPSRPEVPPLTALPPIGAGGAAAAESSAPVWDSGITVERPKPSGVHAIGGAISGVGGAIGGSISGVGGAIGGVGGALFGKAKRLLPGGKSEGKDDEGKRTPREKKDAKAAKGKGGGLYDHDTHAAAGGHVETAPPIPSVVDGGSDGKGSDAAPDPAATAAAQSDSESLLRALLTRLASVPELLVCGDIVHLYHCQGATVPARVSATHPVLRFVQPQPTMIRDHRGNSYRMALMAAATAVRHTIQVTRASRKNGSGGGASTGFGGVSVRSVSVGDRAQRFTPSEIVGAYEDSVGWPWQPFDACGEQCSACLDAFTWQSTSSSAAQGQRDRHHCRGCGLVVCDACSSGRAVIARYGGGQQRVCDRCLWGAPLPGDGAVGVL